MTVRLTFDLSSSFQKQVKALTDKCKKNAPELSLTFPDDGADFYLLAYEQGALCCCAGFTQTGPSMTECSAFTAPAYRNRGYFSLLLTAASEMLPGGTEIIFAVDGNDKDTEITLDALGAAYWYDEHMMELSRIRPVAASSTPFHLAVSGDPASLLYHADFGSCRVAGYDAFYYLYAFSVEEPLRGRGLGRHLLLSVLSDLALRGQKPVRLQVSGDNLPAMSLYQKAGFQISETLSYYVCSTGKGRIKIF